jgi:hypothetical protein
LAGDWLTGKQCGWFSATSCSIDYLINLPDVHSKHIEFQFQIKKNVKYNKEIKRSNKDFVGNETFQNTVSINDNDEIVKVKKSNIKIISDVYNNTDLKEFKKATLSNSLQRLYKKTDVDLTNIIDGKREKKKVVKLDL